MAENPTQTPPAEGTVEIDGKTYTHQQLKDALGKAADYTKKTQDAALDKQDAERWRSFVKEWQEASPEERYQVALMFQQASGYTPPPSNDEDDDDDDRLPRKAVQGFQDEIAALKRQLKEVVGVVKTMADDQALSTTNSKIAQAAQILSTELKRDITPDEVKAAMDETKVADPKAAWLALNYQSLAQVNSGDGPPTPGDGRTKTYTMDEAVKAVEDGSMTETELMRLIDAGAIQSD